MCTVVMYRDFQLRQICRISIEISIVMNLIKYKINFNNTRNTEVGLLYDTIFRNTTFYCHHATIKCGCSVVELATHADTHLEKIVTRLTLVNDVAETHTVDGYINAQKMDVEKQIN